VNLCAPEGIALPAPHDTSYVTVKRHEHHLTWNMFKQIRNLKKIIFLIASNGNAIINDLQIQYFTNEGPMVYGIWSLGVHFFFDIGCKWKFKISIFDKNTMVCECCLPPNKQLVSIARREQVTFRRDHDHVRFVLDKHS
jgi:hypothetical protein